MRLVVLGSAAGGVPGAGNAGSGYLIEQGGIRILLDCGNGVLGELARAAPLEAIDAVFLSHLHHDHVSDLYPYLLQRTRFSPLRVHGPPGASDFFARLLGAFDASGLRARFLDLVEYAPGSRVALGELGITPVAVEHNVPGFGFRVEGGGATIAYTGDTRLCAGAHEVAREADLLLAEATITETLEPADFREKQRQNHMTAREAGALAAKAGAKRLWLTHLMYYLDPAESVTEARGAFEGPVEAARPGMRWEAQR